MRHLAALTVCFALWSNTASAQASLQVPLQFDFLNPGARSLAMGSAFTGLADDATSAFTNPAGLVILTFPEISFEGRGRHYESTFLAGGRVGGPPANIGIDTTASPVYGVSNDDSRGPSYISVVVPHGNFAAAGYRHEFVRVDQEFVSSGVFQGEAVRELALRASRTMDITAYGGSAAYRVHPRLSLGGSLVVYQMHLAAQFSRYTSGFFDPPDFLPAHEIGHAEQHADSPGIGFNVGGLYTLRRGSTSGAHTGAEVVVGGVYRKQPRLRFTGFEGDITAPKTIGGDFQAPTAIGGGIAVKTAQGATFTLDVAHLDYQTLIDGYVAAQSGTKPGNFSIDNVIETHAGFEYVVPVRLSPAMRIGFWFDPDHSVHYNLPANPDSLDMRLAAYLPGADDVLHYTFGGGVAISKQLEINGAADLSPRSTVVSISVVARFAK